MDTFLRILFFAVTQHYHVMLQLFRSGIGCRKVSLRARNFFHEALGRLVEADLGRGAVEVVLALIDYTRLFERGAFGWWWILMWFSLVPTPRFAHVSTRVNRISATRNSLYPFQDRSIRPEHFMKNAWRVHWPFDHPDYLTKLNIR